MIIIPAFATGILARIYTAITTLTKGVTWSSIVAGIVSGITQFFGERGLYMLSALGIGIATYGGIDTISTGIINDLTGSLATIQNQAVSAGSGYGWLSSYAVRYLSYIGFFDALNIVISGFLGIQTALTVGGAVSRFIVSKPTN